MAIKEAKHPIVAKYSRCGSRIADFTPEEREELHKYWQEKYRAKMKAIRSDKKKLMRWKMQISKQKKAFYEKMKNAPPLYDAPEKCKDCTFKRWLGYPQIRRIKQGWYCTQVRPMVKVENKICNN